MLLLAALTLRSGLVRTAWGVLMRSAKADLRCHRFARAMRKHYAPVVAEQLAWEIPLLRSVGYYARGQVGPLLGDYHG